MTKMISQDVLNYTAFFEPAEEGGYVVSVPSLPGCATQGETFEEAKKNVEEAIEGYLAVLLEEKQEIPFEKKGMIISQINVAGYNYGVI